MNWHERFKTQAGWTYNLRQFLYQQIGIEKDSRILEVGSGTGVITVELSSLTSIQPIGVDLSFDRTIEAQNCSKQGVYACGDAYDLPFSTYSFDLVICHYLLIWLKKPVDAIEEMLRVVKPGGVIAALAEPDHLSRVDYPQTLWRLGELQTQALIKQGANPMLGRTLPEIFSQAGVENPQFGASGFQVDPESSPDWLESEWKTLRSDLTDRVPPEELALLEQMDATARQSGCRVLWVPTFYEYGNSPIKKVTNLH